MSYEKKVVFITGSSGFIGFHLASFFLSNDWRVIGLDALTDYYDINLKKARQKLLCQNSNFHTYEGFVQDVKLLNEIFLNHKPNLVVHLAAQAGVRYSIEHPISYVESNLIGAFHILEIARKYKPTHLLMASTSSVYGSNKDYPLHENQKCDTPISFYAATKISNEAMAHSYSHLYEIPITMFRFFTVYGPWGRPDMAPMIFANAIYAKKPIKIFNYGEMSRSFTYIDDIVVSIEKLIEKPTYLDNKFDRKSPNPATSWCPHRIFNIGNNKSIDLEIFISTLEKEIGITALKEYTNMQKGDVKKTMADNTLLKDWVGEVKETSLSNGIKEFISWYKDFYNL